MWSRPSGLGSPTEARGVDAPGWQRAAVLQGRAPASLIDTPNLEDRDGFHAELPAAHRGLSEAPGRAPNAQLVLILANHIGDRQVPSEALDPARRG